MHEDPATEKHLDDLELVSRDADEDRDEEQDDADNDAAPSPAPEFSDEL